jgi:hypothetical protein
MPIRRPPTPTLLAAAILALLPAAPVLAGPQAQGRGNDDRRGHSSLSDAVRRVERNTGGEVLSAERVPYDGREMHRVKVLDDQGRVRVFMQDPRPGRGPDRRDDDGRRPPSARPGDD